MMQDRQFLTIPPLKEDLEKAFKYLAIPNAKYFICLIQTNGKQKLFMEPLKDYVGFCRVFMSPNDLNTYMEYIYDGKKYEAEQIKSYEGSLDQIIIIAKSLNKDWAEKGAIRFTLDHYTQDNRCETLTSIWDGHPN